MTDKTLYVPNNQNYRARIDWSLVIILVTSAIVCGFAVYGFMKAVGLI